ncbi:hypothetical protein [Dyadobacter crusticola]|uniref:hypothetical protein n=1 Tax=Dyadobacter crusticola TaxID=292407 RepID=UPI0012FA640C|nr:hypothetical protein [Dyadobacter crusticola]
MLPDIALKAEAGLRSEVFPLFFSSTLFRTIDDDDSDFLTSADLEVRYYHDAVSKIGLAARLEGFKRAGVDTFDVKQVLTFYFEEYTYKVGSSKDDTWLRKLNHQNISQDELSLIVQTWTGLIVEKINDKLSQICFS